MAKIEFKPTQIEFIFNNVGKLQMKKIAEKLNVSYSKIQSFLKENPTPPWEEQYFNVNALPSNEHTWLI